MVLTEVRPFLPAHNLGVADAAAGEPEAQVLTPTRPTEAPPPPPAPDTETAGSRGQLPPRTWRQLDDLD